MTDLTYEALTDRERALLCNGCGGKGGWFNPPDLRSREFCDRHDIAYYVGGSESDRKAADRELYNSIKADASGRRWWQQPTFRAQAWLYYHAVRMCGAKYFRYSSTKLTLEDLRR